ncbi:MAG TPA: biotin--[acetyl-CoA-carboxylase] ligase [Nevskiaceae bacterium]
MDAPGATRAESRAGRAPVSAADRQLVALTDLLQDGQWTTGAALAANLGVSPGDVAERIDRLRQDWFVDVEQEDGRYRLRRALERLSVPGVVAGLPARWRDGIKIGVAPCVGSTNDELIAGDAADDPQVLLAERQSRGRGRRGRAWVSPFAANLYLSLAWGFAQQPKHITLLPLVTGVCCTRALHRCGVGEVRIKWPNDLYAEGRKLAGILVERADARGAGCRVVIGVGVNVFMTPAQAGGVPSQWTTLEQVAAARHMAAPSRNLLAAHLVAAIADGMVAFARDGFDSFAADWVSWDLTRDRRVTVLEEGRSWNGVARGIDADGALRVEAGADVRTIHAADVSLRL